MVLLERINELGTTVLVVTHEKNLVNRFAKRVDVYKRQSFWDRALVWRMILARSSRALRRSRPAASFSLYRCFSFPICSARRVRSRSTAFAVRSRFCCRSSARRAAFCSCAFLSLIHISP